MPTESTGAMDKQTTGESGFTGLSEDSWDTVNQCDLSYVGWPNSCNEDQAFTSRVLFIPEEVPTVLEMERGLSATCCGVKNAETSDDGIGAMTVSSGMAAEVLITSVSTLTPVILAYFQIVYSSVTYPGSEDSQSNKPN